MDMPGHAPPPAGPGYGDHPITTCLTSGDYSNITRTIPARFPTDTVTGTAELAAAVKRLPVATARDTPIHLAFTPGHIKATAGSGDKADGTGTLACGPDRDPLTVAFHPTAGPAPSPP
jgi:DNA polymerase III subunit beta